MREICTNHEELRVGHGLLKTRARGEHNKHLQTTPAHFHLLPQIHIRMHPSFRVAHRPLISFIGKRQWPPGLCHVFFAICVPTQHGSGPQPQRPHPAAPAQLKEAFSDFLKKYNSPFPSSGRNTQQNTQRLTFKDFWEAPVSLSRPRIRQLEDAEIDAVLVSYILPRDLLVLICVLCYS